MFPRIVACIILLLVIYMLGVFLLPDITDQYGDAQINQKIRSLKSGMENYTGSSTSLFQDLQSQSNKLIDETTKTIDHIQTTVDTKTEQIQQTTESVQKALDAVQKAKSDIEKLSTFSGSSTSK
jgi:peptidoglycan hydrolase CwlO-like protein